MVPTSGLIGCQGTSDPRYLPLRVLPVPDTVRLRETPSPVETVIVAERPPVAAGVNVICRLHEAPTGTAPLQVPPTVNSVGFAPPFTMLAMLSGTLPEFVNVAALTRLVVLICTLAKLIDVGDNVALAIGPAPSCVTVTVFEAAIRLPVRIEPPLLATL